MRRDEEAVVILIELYLFGLILSSTLSDWRASVGLTLDTRGILVRAYTQLCVSPICDFILESCTKEEAVTRVTI